MSRVCKKTLDHHTVNLTLPSILHLNSVLTWIKQFNHLNELHTNLINVLFQYIKPICLVVALHFQPIQILLNVKFPICEEMLFIDGEDDSYVTYSKRNNLINSNLYIQLEYNLERCTRGIV